jgi:hypothetical protein
VDVLPKGDIDLETLQKKKRPLVGFYLYCLQGMLLSTISFVISQIIFSSDYEITYKIYQLLSHSLYIPVIILVLYSFKSIVKIRNKLFAKNIIAFTLFGISLFWIGNTGIIEHDTLFFFSVPIFLYAHNKFILKKFIRGYQLLKQLLHYAVLFLYFLISQVIMIPVLADSGKKTFVKDFYITDIYIKNDAEIYMSNPALIFLVAMVIFISAHRIKKSPKERILLFFLVSILYALLYCIFILYVNYV